MHTQNTQSIREIAIERISSFLDETQIPAWQLGIRAVGNNKFWKKLRTGGEIKIGTLERVEEFMAAERAKIAETARMMMAETAEEYLEQIGEAVSRIEVAAELDARMATGAEGEEAELLLDSAWEAGRHATGPNQNPFRHPALRAAYEQGRRSSQSEAEDFHFKDND